MVFHCRCFSFLFEKDEEIECETRTQTKTSSTHSHSYYSALSDFLAKTSNRLRVFTTAELNAATNNFDRSRHIGEGGFGRVYKGAIYSLEHPFDEIQVAVKYAKGIMRGYQELLTEVNVIGVVVHPNLVKLFGYCMEEGESGLQLFLVYEYMSNGSLRDHLSTSSKTPLSWTRRLKAAQDVARSLAYLDEALDLEIIFRNFKSSNILLDNQWNAKLSDFGFGELGPGEGYTHTSTMSQETMLYAAPEYILTGKVSSKSDVWSYGVFLYELITARSPLDKNLPLRERNLLDWVRPYVQSKSLKRIIDPRLEGACSVDSVQALVNIANLCLQTWPRSRPKMSEVLEMINALIGDLSQPTVPVIEIKCKEVEKTQEDTTNKGEKVSTDIQHTEPATLPPVQPVQVQLKTSKSWFRNKCC